MKQKSLIFFAASWLVVRLRLALISTKSLMANLGQSHEVILVSPRHEHFGAGTWRWVGARLYHLHLEHDPTALHVRPLSEMESN
ncbi:MAG: hypothetical protein ACREOO_26065 [bacterium]